MADTPRALNRDQEFQLAIVRRLDRLNELLTDVRDRLPVPAGSADAGQGTVELTEPAVPTPAGQQELPEPARPASKQSASKKPTAKRTTGGATRSGSKTTTGKTTGGAKRKPASGGNT